MKRQWRFYGTIAAVGGLLVLLVNLTVAWLIRERPNYSRIEAGLYMGGYVERPPWGTKAVLNLDEVADPYRTERSLWSPIPDAPPAPDIDWLRRQVEFIELQRDQKRIVYVHCRNGVSRSGMVVVAALMKRRGWSLDEALAFVQSRRPAVRPNRIFRPLLEEWEQSIDE